MAQTRVGVKRVIKWYFTLKKCDILSNSYPIHPKPMLNHWNPLDLWKFKFVNFRLLLTLKTSNEVFNFSLPLILFFVLYQWLLQELYYFSLSHILIVWNILSFVNKKTQSNPAIFNCVYIFVIYCWKAINSPGDDS